MVTHDGFSRTVGRWGIQCWAKLYRELVLMKTRFKKLAVTVGLPIIILVLLLYPVVRHLSSPGQPAPPDDLELALRNAVRALQPGKIAFESPINMKQSESEKVEVRIAKNVNQDLTKGLGTNGNIKVENIKVGSLMVASLNGSAFRITRLTKEEQAVTDDNYTAWDWEVHPLDWGTHKLYLTVCVRLELPGKREERRCSPVHDREIEVKIDPLYATTHFIKDDPKWSITTAVSGFTFVIGGIVATVRKLRKKERMGFHG